MHDDRPINPSLVLRQVKLLQGWLIYRGEHLPYQDSYSYSTKSRRTVKSEIKKLDSEEGGYPVSRQFRLPLYILS